MPAHPSTSQRFPLQRKYLLLIIGILIAGGLEAASLASHRLPNWVSLPVALTLIATYGRNTIRKGFVALRSVDVSSMDLLMLIAVIGALVTSQFEEAATIIVLFSLSEELEQYGIQSSRSALKALIERVPKTAYMIEQDAAIPIQQLRVGDKIRVMPSEIVPTDGNIIAGSSSVDESTITGEPIPVDKHKGDSAYAGTMNLNGALDIEVTATAQHSTVAKIVELTFNAAKDKAPSQQFIERFARIYTPGIVCLSVGLAIIPPIILHQEFTKWLTQALSLLVIGCPCALVISTPIAIFSAIGAASKQGIVVKGGRSLEALGSIRVMALDKTRTLTYGKPTVTDILPMNGVSKEHLLACAAGIEQYSEHPLARSIVEAASEEQIKPHAIENFQSVFGMGAKAECLVCEDREHTIGKLQFIQTSVKVQAEVLKEVDRLHAEGKTSVIVASDNVEGIIALSDVVRPEAKFAIAQIKALDIIPVILTGDNISSARALAKQIGIEEIQAELLPEMKAGAVKDLKRKFGAVAMVGDGVNDAPALAAATVGIAMGASGSDMAIETASIALLNDNISLLPFLIKLGRRTVRLIKINIAFTLFVKAVFIGLAVWGMSNLALALLADVGVTLIVVVLGLTLMRYVPSND